MHTGQRQQKNGSTQASAAGRRAVVRQDSAHQALLSSKLTPKVNIQPKLSIGQPGDKHEQEADRVAEHVVSQPLQRTPSFDQPATAKPQPQRPPAITPVILQQAEETAREEEQTPQTKSFAEQITPLVQRQIEEEEEEILQTKVNISQAPEVGPDLESRILALRGGGQPLPKSARSFFEPRFGHDFSQVRIHTDARAAESAATLNAKAFTLGRNMVFGAGHYTPGAKEGQRLLAHELTHILQQQPSQPKLQLAPQALSPVQERGKTSETQRPPAGHFKVKLRLHLTGKNFQTKGSTKIARFEIISTRIPGHGGQFDPDECRLLEGLLTEVLITRLPQENLEVLERFDEPQVTVPLFISFQALNDYKFTKGYIRGQTVRAVAKQIRKIVHGLIFVRVETFCVDVDRYNPARILFNVPVTLDEAIAYLWDSPPKNPNAIRLDPQEHPVEGRQRGFLVDISDSSLILSMRHGLPEVYLIRAPVLISKGPTTFPKWVPGNIQNDLLQRRLPNGVKRFPGIAPWGDIVVWVSSHRTVCEIYQEFSEDRTFWLEITHGREREARLLHLVHAEYNRDMRYFVDEQGLSPELARAKIKRIGEECLKLVLLGAILMLSGGMDIELIRSFAPRIIDAERRTRFLRRRGLMRRPETGEAAEVAEAMPEKLREGMTSRAPPVSIKGEVIKNVPVVRKNVTRETFLGRTQFGRKWAAASIRAQEKALKKLKTGGVESAKIRQSFNAKGELVLDYVGRSVAEQWPRMSRVARQGYRAYVRQAKKVLKKRLLHDLKKRNIAYQQIAVGDQIIHRFIAFDPALDRYTIIVGMVVGGTVGTMLGTTYVVVGEWAKPSEE